MKKFWIFSAILIVAIAFYVYGNFKEEAPSETLAKCYHGIVGDSNSVFTINEQTGIQVSGEMSFVFAQKDSSYGTFKGTYEKGLLTVAYTFWSEGIQSIGDYEFKKDGANFKGSGYTYLPATDCEKFLKK